MHLYICIVAPHLGTLDVQRTDVKHAVMEPNYKTVIEPNYKTVFGGYLKKMEGPTEATEDPAQGRKGPRPC